MISVYPYHHHYKLPTPCSDTPRCPSFLPSYFFSFRCCPFFLLHPRFSVAVPLVLFTLSLWPDEAMKFVKQTEQQPHRQRNNRRLSSSLDLIIIDESIGMMYSYFPFYISIPPLPPLPLPVLFSMHPLLRSFYDFLIFSSTFSFIH